MSISENKKLVRLMIASGESDADVRYASGLSTPDAFIFFEYGGRRCAVMSALELTKASLNHKPGVEVIDEKDFGGPKRLDVLKRILAECRADGFVVPHGFPFGIAAELMKNRIAVEVSQEPFFPEREFKEAPEIEKIVEAQRAGEAGLARAVEVLRESSISGDTIVWRGQVLTSELLRAEIDTAMLRRGMLITGTICAGGVQGAQPHHTGSGALRPDMPIVMDIFPRSATTGYWGDLTRTVVKGSPADVVRRAYDAVLEARERGKNLIKIGAQKAEIHNAAAAILEKHRFFTGSDGNVQFGFFHGLGHGVGLDIHEMPRLSPRASGKLQGGEVVTVEPGLYYPEWGGIRLEDLVWLKPDGSVRCLTEAPDFLVIE